MSSGPASDGMRSLCQDASGTLWTVTQSGRLARKDGWFGPAANCVTAASQGGVWVGTESGGLRWWRQGEVRALTQQDGLASQSVIALLTTPLRGCLAGDTYL